MVRSGRNDQWKPGILPIVTVLIFLNIFGKIRAGSGCANGKHSALSGFSGLAACDGNWTGHIRNGSTVCAAGWRVCSWYDADLLKQLTWDDAISFSGCYAYNAAQDGGRCKECRDDMGQDDMAGIGQGCTHQNIGQTSCIPGGRIDASCCVDSHFHRACQHQPGLTNGVFCCKMPVKLPRIVVKPPEKMHVYTGLIFLLACQATGMPPPRVQWYKDGTQLSEENSRISVLSSGDLIVTLARKSDSGLYTCEVINEEGIDMASSYVVVAEYDSGCADGTTEGLHIHKNIHACGGSWKGHVRRGRSLCRKGWRVCNPKDRNSLEELTWLDMFDLAGCYAYNAATYKGACKKCVDSRMAGVGRQCGLIRYSQKSCLSHGRVDVFNPRNSVACEYKEGAVSGVLCCKKKKKKSHKKKLERRRYCRDECKNGGVCVGHNRCHCAIGYKGASCQNAICKPGCGSKGHCIKPNKCKCQLGYSGKHCNKKSKGCKRPCLNGGRCLKRKCQCPQTHWGNSCQYLLQHILLSKLNRTER
ncbi:hypothetical protein SNE40_007547 [Patella caerulea]|uniref:Uncharacterized protein n=1 Tax=Patella caerulea TaxID=87958 RepID=A0AAN8PXL3_PATCE